MIKPKKWYDVYPYGTKEGDEEAKVFRALSRHQKFDFRSTGALQQETGLSRERIEEILDKYMTCEPPLIYPHLQNEEHWAYWERCPDRVQDNTKNISDKDQDDRIDKHLSGAVDMIGSVGSTPGPTASKINSLADLVVTEKEWTLDV
jgi:hypothetical protein